MLKLNIDVTYEGLKVASGYCCREKGKNKLYPIFKSTMQYSWEDVWENFPLSPETFHDIFDCIPNNNLGLNIPYNMVVMMGSYGTLPPTMARFERAIDKTGREFQYAKFAAGHYCNGQAASSCFYEQIYIVNSLGEKICIKEDYTLGPSIRTYNLP